MFNYSLLVIGAIFLPTARESNVWEASISHFVHSGGGGSVSRRVVSASRRDQPPGGSTSGRRGTPLQVLTSSGSHCRGIWRFLTFPNTGSAYHHRLSPLRRLIRGGAGALQVICIYCIMYMFKKQASLCLCLLYWLCHCTDLWVFLTLVSCLFSLTFITMLAFVGLFLLNCFSSRVQCKSNMSL